MSNIELRAGMLATLSKDEGKYKQGEKVEIISISADKQTAIVSCCGNPKMFTLPFNSLKPLRGGKRRNRRTHRQRQRARQSKRRRH